MLETDDSSQDNKVVLVGDMGVGKTTIINRFTTGIFDPDVTSTIGAGSVKAKVVLKGGDTINLTIWDTAGQERYQSLIPLYLRKARGVILVCDVNAKNTIPTLDAIYTSLTDVDNDCVMILVGNKIDLCKQTNFSELNQWANDHNMSYFSASAKTGIGIEDIFVSIAEQISKCSDFSNNEFNKQIKKRNSYCCL